MPKRNPKTGRFLKRSGKKKSRRRGRRRRKS
jgi:hypothetical protein